jgi:hypothetical protein
MGPSEIHLGTGVMRMSLISDMETRLKPKNTLKYDSFKKFLPLNIELILSEHFHLL